MGPNVVAPFVTYSVSMASRWTAGGAPSAHVTPLLLPPSLEGYAAALRCVLYTVSSAMSRTQTAVPLVNATNQTSCADADLP